MLLLSYIQTSLQDLGLEPASTKDSSPLVPKKAEVDDEIVHTPGPKVHAYLLDMSNSHCTSHPLCLITLYRETYMRIQRS